MATASSTMCTICMEYFNNPKSLPCLHTFCLKCLESYFKGVRPACPLCRKEFQIPAEGLGGLPHNFWIQQNLDEKKMSATRATKDRSGGSHTSRTAGISGDSKVHCDKHEGKELELYCVDCSVNICAVCVTKEHRRHECEQIDEAAEKLMKQIDKDRVEVSRRLEAAREQANQTKKERNKLLDRIKEVEESIKLRGEEVKRMVDSQVQRLLQMAQAAKVDLLKEVETREETLDTALVAMESFSAHSLEVKTKGKPSDITRVAGELHDRAVKLLEKYVVTGNYRAPDISFTPVDVDSLMTAGQSNLVGSLSTGSVTSRTSEKSGVVPTAVKDTSPIPQLPARRSETRLLDRMADGRYIYGITQIEEEIYLLRDKRTEQVEVYHVNDFRLKRRVSVAELRDKTDLASCEHYRCLYIADNINRCVCID